MPPNARFWNNILELNFVRASVVYGIQITPNLTNWDSKNTLLLMNREKSPVYYFPPLTVRAVYKPLKGALYFFKTRLVDKNQGR